jgi:DNA processing protein
VTGGVPHHERPGADDLPMEAYLAALASLPEVGPATLRRLLRLGDPASVWERVVAGLVPLDVVAVRGRPPGDTVGRWRVAAAAIDPAGLWDRCRRLGVGVSSLGSPGYPPVLAADIEPPVALFHRGDPDVLAARRVAVVGTRRATGYGRRVAADLGEQLAADGICVVSGLALGIDAAAHAGALRVHGGAGPVAVVAGGPEEPGPQRNREVADGLVRRGAVLSEAPPGVGAAPWRFPVRNRVLAALAEAVVVVESAAAGGSMHTVREALRRDRTVLAVPGPVDSAASAGTNQLISEGALVCRDVDDVRCALGLGRRPNAAGPADPRPVPDGDAATVLDALDWRPTTLSQLAERSGLGVGPLVVALGVLERDGWVDRRGGWVERIARAGEG